MVLATGSFADDLGVGPAQAAEVHGEGDASEPGGGRGATTFADRDFIFYAQSEGCGFAARGLQHIAVGVENEVIFELAANFAVAARGGDGEFVGGTSIEMNVEIHGEGGGVERGAEVGGRGREGESELFRGCGFRWHSQSSGDFGSNPAGAKGLFSLPK